MFFVSHKSYGEGCPAVENSSLKLPIFKDERLFFRWLSLKQGIFKDEGKKRDTPKGVSP